MESMGKEQNNSVCFSHLTIQSGKILIPDSSSTEKDRWGTEHLHMKFYVEGPLNQGVVHVHMTKKPSQDEYEYKTLAVDVKGK